MVLLSFFVARRAEGDSIVLDVPAIRHFSAVGDVVSSEVFCSPAHPAFPMVTLEHHAPEGSSHPLLPVGHCSLLYLADQSKVNGPIFTTKEIPCRLPPALSIKAVFQPRTRTTVSDFPCQPTSRCAHTLAKTHRTSRVLPIQCLILRTVEYQMDSIPPELIRVKGRMMMRGVHSVHHTIRWYVIGYSVPVHDE